MTLFLLDRNIYYNFIIELGSSVCDPAHHKVTEQKTLPEDEPKFGSFLELYNKLIRLFRPVLIKNRLFVTFKATEVSKDLYNRQARS